MNKRLANELKSVLQKNVIPPIQYDLRSAQIQELSRSAQKMDILSRHSLLEHILLQASYLSRWIWFVQTMLLLMLYYYSFQGNQLLVFSGMLLLTPCLTLILLYEISKSASCGMWEMEAPCRYSHWQLLAMRLCFLSGIDAVVLLGALISFRMTGGALWQFALYVLIPFLLTSALCLHIMQICAHRISQYLLSALALALSGLIIPLLHKCSDFMQIHHMELFKEIIGFSTLGVLLLFIRCAVRLCRRQTDKDTILKNSAIF